ncbi:hypothetical protein CBL_20084 [Carabus blaptoides fortunei]
MIHKRGKDPSNPSSYGPIALLNTMGKFFLENRVVCVRIGSELLRPLQEYHKAPYYLLCYIISIVPIPQPKKPRVGLAQYADDTAQLRQETAFNGRPRQITTMAPHHPSLTLRQLPGAEKAAGRATEEHGNGEAYQHLLSGNARGQNTCSHDHGSAAAV